MGEAKRRRDRANQPIEFLDVATNERKKARNAGDPVEFLARLKASVIAEERGERPITNVACNGCTACCYYHQVDFDPRKERREDLAHLEMVGIEGGRVRLKKRDDGACIHLGDASCTVYAHRPRPCRLYDCRGVALVSMVDTFDGGQLSPFWIFDPHTRKGEIIKQGFQFLGMAHQANVQKSGKSSTAAETFAYALKNIDQYCAAMEEISKLPPDQLAKILGFDPRNVTEEDYISTMTGIMKAMTSGVQTATFTEESQKMKPPSEGG
jgi:Fe-S-cluster containining protein